MTKKFMFIVVALLAFAPVRALATHVTCGGGSGVWPFYCADQNQPLCSTVKPPNSHFVGLGDRAGNRCALNYNQACHECGGPTGWCNECQAYLGWACDAGYVQSGSTCVPPCAPNQGTSCQSAANICGMRNSGTIQCNGSCNASIPSNNLCPAPTCATAPSNPIVGQSVTATGAGAFGSYTWNSGGGNPATGPGNPKVFTYATTGAKTITVTDTATGKTNTCSTTICVATFNQACQSAGVNACNMHGTGTIQCDGSCNAVVPPASACPAPTCVAAPANPQTGSIVTATGSSGAPPYTWNSGGGIPGTGGGTSFNTLYAVSGPRIITVSDSTGKSGACNVNVGAAFTANGTVTTVQNQPLPIGFGTSYTVRVRVWDADGRMGEWSTPFAYSTKPGPWPVADFDYVPAKTIAKQQIQFTDKSLNGPTSWLWDFGDGSTSAQQNPPYTYAAEGSYSVTLQATNLGGTCSVTKNLGIIKPIPTYREIRPGQTPLPRPSPTPTPPPNNPTGAGENGR